MKEPLGSVVVCLTLARALRLGLALVVFGLSVIAAQAQDYPNRPIHIVIPFAPGGVVDLSARIVAEKLGSVLGQQIVTKAVPERAACSAPAS
jgi:tripartite-type tricarboxylate transporter receptor subunit TctC